MHKIVLSTIIFLCLFSLGSNAQNLSNRELFKIAKRAPDSTGYMASDIADYFITKTTDQKELVLLFNYWIRKNIAYDIEKYESNNMQYTSVWDTLETKKTMCQGYSELLSELCYWADIECEVVFGYVKGLGYDGKPLKNTNHIWNAVKIGNSWQLIDVTWSIASMNYISGDLVIYNIFRNKYVFANPNDLILSHFPENPKWQLLNNPITMNTFFSESHERKRLRNTNVW